MRYPHDAEVLARLGESPVEALERTPAYEIAEALYLSDPIEIRLAQARSEGRSEAEKRSQRAMLGMCWVIVALCCLVLWLAGRCFMVQ